MNAAPRWIAVKAVLVLVVTGCTGQPARVSALPPSCPGSDLPAYAFGTAYESSVGISAVRPDGEVVRLTNDAMSSSPSFTPNGRSIVFVRSAVGAPTAGSPADGSSVWIMGADGSQQRELLRMTVVDSVSVSPDGQQLAMIGQLRTDRPDRGVYVAGIDGGGLRRVYSVPNDVRYLFGDAPAWSPDGTEVAVAITDNGRVALYAIAIMDGAWRSVTEAVSVADPSWSADGSVLSFVATVPRRGENDSTLFAVDAAGGQPRQVVADVQVGTMAAADATRWLAHKFGPENGPPHELLLVGPGGVLDRIELPTPDGYVVSATLAPCALR